MVRLLVTVLSCTCLKIQYKEDLGGGTALSETPEMERVKRNQQNISTVHHGVTLPLPQHSSPLLPSMLHHSLHLSLPLSLTLRNKRQLTFCNPFETAAILFPPPFQTRCAELVLMPGFTVLQAQISFQATQPFVVSKPLP